MCISFYPFSKHEKFYKLQAKFYISEWYIPNRSIPDTWYVITMTNHLNQRRRRQQQTILTMKPVIHALTAPFFMGFFPVTTHVFVLNVLGVIYMGSSGLLLLLVPRFLLLITFLLLSLVGFFPVYVSFSVNWYICFFFSLNCTLIFLFYVFLKRFLLRILKCGILVYGRDCALTELL